MQTLRAFDGDHHSVTDPTDPTTIFDKNGNVMFLVNQSGNVTSQHGFRQSIPVSSGDSTVLSRGTSTCMFGYSKASESYRDLISLVQVSKKIK